MENPFKKKIEEKKEMDDLKKDLLKRTMDSLKEEMSKDESEMTLEEKKAHTEKLKALNDVLKEVKGEDKAKGKQIALQVGLKAGLIVIGIGIEALLLRSGHMTRMKEKFIDNIMRI